MNQVNIIGRITHDLELKRTGEKVFVRFGFAVNRGKETVDFLDIAAFEKTAELITKYCAKGTQLGISGYIQTGQYQNKEKVNVKTFTVVANEITFIGSKNDTKEEEKDNRPF